MRLAESLMQMNNPTLSGYNERRRGQWLLFAGGGLVVLLIALICVGVGSVYIPPDITVRLLLSRLPLVHITADWPATLETILFDIRLPRVLLVGLTGAALAASGTAYQGLFRNPLADPYLIGVAAGAGLGAIWVVALPWVIPFGVPLGAFGGALLTVALVYWLGRSNPHSSALTLILAGVAVGALATAISTFLLLRMNNQTTRVLAFLLGGYGNTSWEAVKIVGGCTAFGFGVLYLYAQPLNVLLFDEEQARQLGINVDQVMLVVVIAATLTTATAVAFSGLIGFVGLIVPHTIRLLTGADHRRLLPLAALGGAGFLLLADLLARTLIAPSELPLGVVTALAGAPFFLWLLRRSSTKL